MSDEQIAFDSQFQRVVYNISSSTKKKEAVWSVICYCFSSTKILLQTVCK